MIRLSKQKQSAFTLIELLVVIAIIGLLSSVVLVSITSARMKARDTKRKADLKQMRSAIEWYATQNGNYPIVAPWATSEASTYDSGTKWAALQTALAPFMPKLPNDPLGTGAGGPWTTGTYHYAYGSTTGTIYDLVAQLENANDPERCSVKSTLYHQGEGTIPPNSSWCGNYSGMMYADH